MNFFRYLLTVIIFSAQILLPPAPASAQLKITTTILPLTAHTMSLCGDLAYVRQLLPANVGIHNFNPRPSDVRWLQQSDLLIINGLGLEPWIDSLLQSSSKRPIIIDASVGIKTIDDRSFALESCALDHSDAGLHDHNHHHHHHAGPNPHIWLDPVLSKQQVQNILQGLIRADPKNKARYQANASTYLKRLDALHQQFTQTLAPLKKKSLLTFHNSFPYFARRYGIQYLGYVEALPEQSPSPKRVAKLIKIIKENKAEIIFTEVGYSPRLMQILARETGARIASLNTLETGKPNPEAYFKAMQANLETLKKAWQ